MRLLDDIEHLWTEIESDISFNIQHVIGLNKDNDCSFTQVHTLPSILFFLFSTKSNTRLILSVVSDLGNSTPESQGYNSELIIEPWASGVCMMSTKEPFLV